MSSRPLVGLIPAAGTASRAGPLPCSKEVLPVGVLGPGGDRPRVACEGLLDAMREGGAARAYVVLRAGKWDIPAYLGTGDRVGLPLAYLVNRGTAGVPHTLDQAHPFVDRATVLLGFPDIIVRAPEPVFPRLLDRLETTGAAAVLGLFPSSRPDKGDMVETDAEGRVRRVVVKSSTTDLRSAWVVAVWGPAFTSFLHERVGRPVDPAGDPGAELHLGPLFEEAAAAGLDVRGVAVPGGRYIDLGTPEELAAYVSGAWEKARGDGGPASGRD